CAKEANFWTGYYPLDW
nr:immunoglobulin heavy chain junction region [Macaca mulatta]MOW32152.1 immunoglobulin heavy chain junction region [Macaca mulatta]MOW32173.1 immunoglobulin heavy chain junction region [Macaca mulatta]MOW32253.1 immunoglobulin heavy chain junction region [Macaca mulatta]MOW32287.1 immunoglobulin heavy chain junction region [Macaca mulatta]